MATEGGAMAVGGIVVPLGLDTSSVPADLRRLSGEMEQWKAKQLQQMTALRNLGFVMSATMTLPIEMFVKRSISESIMAEQVSKRLNISLRNMGGSAGITRREIDDLGMSMLRMSNYTDEATRSAAASLLKFKVIRGDVFRDTLKTSADMAAALEGVSLESAAQMLGRAMVNPGQGSQMLRRAGIVFSRPEQERIKELGKSGDPEKAQRYMLSAINERVGGASKEMQEPFVQMKNAFGEVMESTGAYVRKQFLLDQGATLLRDTFLSLSDKINKTHSPFLSLTANLVAVASKLPPIVTVIGQYAKTANDIRQAFANFAPGVLGGAAGGIAGKMVSRGAGTMAGEAATVAGATVAAETARAMWMREHARKTSQAAVEAERLVAANDAKYGTRFRPASAYAQEAEAERLRGLAKSQHGRASFLERQALQAERAGATTFAKAAPLGRGGVLMAEGAMTGAGFSLVTFAARAVPPIAAFMALYVATHYAGKILTDAMTRVKASPEDAKITGIRLTRAEQQARVDMAAAKYQETVDRVVKWNEDIAPQMKEASGIVEDAQIRMSRLGDETPNQQLESLKRDEARLRGRTLSEENGGLSYGVKENYTLEDVKTFMQNSIQKYGGSEAMEDKVKLEKDKKTAEGLVANYEQRKNAENDIVKSQAEYNRQIQLSTKDIEREQSSRQLGQETIDTVLKAASADPEAFKRTVGMGIGPDFLTKMNPAELDKFTTDVGAAKGKQGIGDMGDLGFQIKQADVQRQKVDLAKEMGIEGELNLDSLKQWIGTRGDVSNMKDFEREAISRQTNEARGLLGQEDQLKVSRYSRLQGIQANSTWEQRNVAGAVEQGSLAGYQASIVKEKQGASMEQIEKNTAAMQDFLRQLVEWMTGGKATNQLSLSVEAEV